MKRLHVRKQFLQFVAVGITNTAVDFIAFYVLSTTFGVYFVVANIISTTLALATSFILNSKYTFDKVAGKRGIVLFLIITLAGIWILQPVVIYISLSFMAALLAGASQGTILLACKVAASVASLIWNYVMYKKFVFTDK